MRIIERSTSRGRSWVREGCRRLSGGPAVQDQSDPPGSGCTRPSGLSLFLPARLGYALQSAGLCALDCGGSLRSRCPADESETSLVAARGHSSESAHWCCGCRLRGLVCQSQPGGENPMPDLPRRMMYTVVEAAALLGISKSTAHELITRGELEAVRLGGRRLISPVVLETLIGERPPPPV